MAPCALVAPDSFKGTFDAPTVARALSDGLRQAGWETDVCPVADGGEGSLALLVEALGGELVEVMAGDPFGRRVECAFGLVDGGATAIVEMALASGLALVDPGERDAWRASTSGTGELILAAAGTGAREILVAVGGSATTDGGAGAIATIRDGGGLGDARRVVLCDVESAFEDAPRIFGPQKGADPALVERLEARLDALAATLPRDPRGVRFGGCAGGLSGGLWAAFGAELRAGARAVLDALDVDERMRTAQLVVAGEGCLDEQSFGGKIVGELVRRAGAAGVAVHAVVGTSRLSDDEAARFGLRRVWTASTFEQLVAAGRALGEACDPRYPPARRRG
ncbi:MAG: glycerate 2-kinase [Solirubrobacteraceae bacterium]|nr:glycerate 2-kinase [Solirubrobacteraceae bacterium]